MDAVIIVLVILTLYEGTCSLNVSLNGPEYIKAGDEVWVNCSTNMTPYEQIAEFLVNGVTFKTLQKKQNGCYSAISNVKCLTDSCQCSADGKAYSLKIKDAHPNTILNISCSMKFRFTDQPIFASASISISVLGPPVLKVFGKTVYNSSDMIQISCYMFGNLETYGFDFWSHTVNGVLIRHLKGESNGNLSILAVRRSSYSDSGCYSCNAWNTKGETKYWSNKTTSVVVNAAPVIIRTYTYNDTLPTFSVIYFANPLANIPQWFKYTTLLIDSPGFSILNIKRNISFKIYGKLTQQTIYSSNLSMEEHTPGKYTVILSNEYGQVRTTFNWKPDKPGQLFLFGLLVLTGMTVFILTAGVIAVVTKIKSTIGDPNFKQYHPNNRRAIYYAAPEDENTTHVYHRTDAEYEEPSPGHYMEISDIDIDRNSSTADDNQYEIAHDYIELE